MAKNPDQTIHAVEAAPLRVSPGAWRSRDSVSRLARAGIRARLQLVDAQPGHAGVSLSSLIFRPSYLAGGAGELGAAFAPVAS